MRQSVPNFVEELVDEEAAGLAWTSRDCNQITPG
jgi:hypothetical protein